MPAKRNGKRQVWVRDVAMAHDSDDCLPAPFNANPNGYVAFREDGKTCYIHRRVCELHRGPAPTSDHEAAHSCNNRACGNKRHLDWKLHDANMADQAIHGTRVMGEKCGAAKLTADNVRHIRASRSTGKFLADFFGVTPGLVSMIRSDKIWRHL